MLCCPRLRLQSNSYTSLLVGDQQKDLAMVVKDYLGLKNVEHELRTALKRQPTVEEWANAVKMETGWVPCRGHSLALQPNAAVPSAALVCCCT